MVLLHLLENTFDRKCISANPTLTLMFSDLRNDVIFRASVQIPVRILYSTL